jgi:formylmethanofuran dehydrogenase subunit B
MACGTPQYIKKDQRHRKCPRCDKQLDCNKHKAIAWAETINEAIEIVKELKTPAEMQQRIFELKHKIQNTSNAIRDNYALLGDLITELLYTFPNSMPQSIIIQKAIEIGLEDQEFITTTLNAINQKGDVLINQDQRGNKVYKFINLPIYYQKLKIQYPQASKQINKEREKERYMNKREA